MKDTCTKERSSKWTQSIGLMKITVWWSFISEFATRMMNFDGIFFSL
jgi:hypothetical protein